MNKLMEVLNMMTELELSREAFGRAKKLLDEIDRTSSDSRLRGLMNARNEIDIAYRHHEHFLEKLKEMFEISPEDDVLRNTFGLAVLQQAELTSLAFEIGETIAKERLIRELATN